MRKEKDILGKPIYACDSGQKLNNIVEDLIVSHYGDRLLGFLVSKNKRAERCSVLPLSQVKAIKLDSVIVFTKEAIVPAATIKLIYQSLEPANQLRGISILTQDGQALGVITNLYFNAQTGTIEGYEVIEGLFAAPNEVSFVPAPSSLTLRGQTALVPSETIVLMKEKVVDEHLAKAISGIRFQINQNVQEAVQIETAFNAGTSKQQLLIGKTVKQTVYTPGGIPILVRGQKITPALAEVAKRWQVLDDLYEATEFPLEKRSQQADRKLLHLLLEQLKGKRVVRLVRNEEGIIIAATGQIVTSTIIENAKRHFQELALLKAVINIPHRKEGKSDSCLVLDKKANTQYFQHNDNLAWEKQINNALGCPVKKVILDQQNQVILNIGDLITYRAVERARQAGVIKELLESVYRK